jgi:hypothetical protein
MLLYLDDFKARDEVFLDLRQGVIKAFFQVRKQIEPFAKVLVMS